MKTLTLSTIVGGLILAGIIVTVHSCNSNPEPVAKPSIDSGDSGDSKGTSEGNIKVLSQPSPAPTPVVTQTPSPLPPFSPSPSPSLSLSPTLPKQKLYISQDRCFSVRVPASSNSAPTITPVPCK